MSQIRCANIAEPDAFVVSFGPCNESVFVDGSYTIFQGALPAKEQPLVPPGRSDARIFPRRNTSHPEPYLCSWMGARVPRSGCMRVAVRFSARSAIRKETRRVATVDSRL